MAQLNDAQRTAVLHSAGSLLVFAGAGSGKTRVITYRVARLIAEEHVAPHRILAVTFTNKAAAEMKARLEALTGPGLANDLWVGTFHSISAQLLRRYGSELGLNSKFSIYDDSDQKALINRVIKAGRFDERTYTPKTCLSRIHAQKREGRGPREVEVSPNFDDALVTIYEGYERALRAANAVDFDDLIFLMVRLLEAPRGDGSPLAAAAQQLRDRYDYVLVDEFQDTNTIQYRWVRAFAARSGNLCVVGDDDQSIYSWRGADIRNIRDFSKDFPGALVVKLEQNYRSTGNIVKAACHIIAEAEERQEKSLWTDSAPGHKLVITAYQDERNEATGIVQLLKQRIRDGIDPGQLAVFYRVNAQSRVLEEALRRQDLPYQIVGGMRFFERAEVKNLLSYLRWLDNPLSDADIVRFFNVPVRGLGAKTLDRLLSRATEEGVSLFEAMESSLESGAISGAPKKRLHTFVTLLRDLRKRAKEAYPSELAEMILERTGYRESLQTQNTAEADARLENLAELVGSIKEFESDSAATSDPTDDAIPSLNEYLERVALVADVDAVKEGTAVLLMTIHSAKGLEFDSVFLTGMEEETFPYRGLQSDSNEELEEERRLAYVAVTRARQRLYISHAATRTIFGQTRYLAPSRFLAAIPSDLVEQRGIPAWQSRVSGAAGLARKANEGQYGQGSPGQGNYSRSRYDNSGARSQRGAENWDQRPAQYDEFSQIDGDRSGKNQSSNSPSKSDTSPSSGASVDYGAFDDLAAQEPLGSLQRGMAVYHRRFGKGIVEQCEGDKVVARFKGYGTKKVLGSFLSLQP